MEERSFESLPEEIRGQIRLLLEESGNAADGDAAEQYARIWEKKFELFTAQVSNVGMEIINKIEKDDARGAILLTYSGSLVSLGPAREGKRWLEYASIKFRTDVPDYVRGQGVSLASPVTQGSVAEFEGSPLKKSSAIYRIAACPVGTTEGDQDERIREATIFLTNGFMRINRTAHDRETPGMEQFSPKAIVALIAKKHGVTQVLARAIVDEYLATVEAGVLLGERVSIGRLGSMALKLQEARKARVMKNIATGEDILVPAKPACPVPKFTVAKSLKEKGAGIDPSSVGLESASLEGDEED